MTRTDDCIVDRFEEREDVLLSLIIPTCDRPELLRRCLCAVEREHTSDVEVIVVNDASTVNYDHVIEEFSSVISRYIRLNSRSGVSAARNAGIQESTGAWIMFVDDDDELLDGALKQAKLFLKQRISMRSFHWMWVKVMTYSGDSSDVRENYMKLATPSSKKSPLRDVLAVGASYGLIVHRDVFKEVGNFSHSYKVGEDTELILRCLAAGIVAEHIPYVGIAKHNHVSGRLSAEYRRYSEICVYERMMKEHDAFFSKHPDLHKQLLGWTSSTHYSSGNYADGDRALIRIIKILPLDAGSFENFCAALLLRFSNKYPGFERYRGQIIKLYRKLR